MNLAAALAQDYHVHSTFSDGVSTLAQNAQAARRRGLRRLCLTDHVRRDTTWLADYVSAVEAVRDGSGTEIVTGVEAKILNQAGELDLPADLGGVDLVLIADHQFPGEDGPVLPGEMRALIERGTLSPATVISALIDATVRALARASGRQAVIAHLFSLVPKMGLSESGIADGELDLLAGRARDTGALLEVNEKWSCPSARTVSAFAAAGVPVVAGSDSHDCADIGVYTTVRETLSAAADGSLA
jgi:putative hydrolase